MPLEAGGRGWYNTLTCSLKELDLIPHTSTNTSKLIYTKNNLNQFFKMAMSQAAYKAEQALGHNDNSITAQDVTNPANDREKYGDSSETMKALCWMGKNKVEVRT